MAPTLLRCQVTLDRLSGLPVDESMNTWHFWSEATDRLDDVALVTDALRIFYQTIDGLLSSRLAGTASIKTYDLFDIVPRPPIDTFAFTFTPDTGPDLPSECAICLSFRGPSLAGAIPARNRGRIYLGPLSSATVDSSIGDVIVDSGVRGAIASAADTMRTGLLAGTATWAVFSPTIAGAGPWTMLTLAQATAFVERGYVDDAFDTVRSRGAAPNARTAFP